MTHVVAEWSRSRTWTIGTPSATSSRVWKRHDRRRMLRDRLRCVRYSRARVLVACAVVGGLDLVADECVDQRHLRARPGRDSVLSTGRQRAGLVLAPSALLSIFVAAISMWALTTDRSSEATDRAFAGLAVTSLVASPLGWIYYLWFAAVPSLALWRTRAVQHHGARERYGSLYRDYSVR
jgi:hypothetical protein